MEIVVREAPTDEWSPMWVQEATRDGQGRGMSRDDEERDEMRRDDEEQDKMRRDDEEQDKMRQDDEVRGETR